MNLEEIEQKCLSYLKQVTNPLVSLDSLERYLRENADCEGFSDADLLDFLQKHELFTVLNDPHAQDQADTLSQLQAAGLSTGPQVILCTRVPTQENITAMMYEQLESMIDALNKAANEAQAAGDQKAHEKVLEALARAQKLKGMSENLFKKEI